MEGAVAGRSLQPSAPSPPAQHSARTACCGERCPVQSCCVTDEMFAATAVELPGKEQCKQLLFILVTLPLGTSSVTRLELGPFPEARPFILKA